MENMTAQIYICSKFSNKQTANFLSQLPSCSNAGQTQINQDKSWQCMRIDYSDVVKDSLRVVYILIQFQPVYSFSVFSVEVCNNEYD